MARITLRMLTSEYDPRALLTRHFPRYVYFEKRRIAEGKKKSAKRIRAEEEQGGGLPREDHSRVWVFTAAR